MGPGPRGAAAAAAGSVDLVSFGLGSSAEPRVLFPSPERVPWLCRLPGHEGRHSAVSGLPGPAGFPFASPQWPPGHLGTPDRGQRHPAPSGPSREQLCLGRTRSLAGSGGDRPRRAQSRGVGGENAAGMWPRSHEAGPRVQTGARTATRREGARHGRAPRGFRTPGRVCGRSGRDGHADCGSRPRVPGACAWQVPQGPRTRRGARGTCGQTCRPLAGAARALSAAPGDEVASF